MSFTAKELENALMEEGDGYWGEFGYSPYRFTLNGKEYTTEPVEDIGGGEGSGEYTAVIFRVDGRLFRKEGYYASHYGTDWDGSFEEVEQYTKKVKAYRAV